MKKYIAAALIGVTLMAAPAVAHSGGDRVERLQERVQRLVEQRDDLRTQVAVLESRYERSTNCSSTQSCKPVGYQYEPWQNDDGYVFRVRFVENVGADQYRWFAGPFFTLGQAQKAADKISDASGTIDGSVRIETSSTPNWLVYAD